MRTLPSSRVSSMGTLYTESGRTLYNPLTLARADLYLNPRHTLYTKGGRDEEGRHRGPDLGDRRRVELGTRRGGGVRSRGDNVRHGVRRDERHHPGRVRPRWPFRRVARRSLRDDPGSLADVRFG